MTPGTVWRTDEPCPVCATGLTLLDDGGTQARAECRLCGYTGPWTAGMTCPECTATAPGIAWSASDRRWRDSSGELMLTPTHTWHCLHCGHRWTTDGYWG